MKTFLYHLEQSRFHWRMARSGSRQNDSPGGRYHDEQALGAFLQLSEEEKASLPPETRQEFEDYAEQSKLIEESAS